MSDIDHKSPGSILKPLKSLQFFSRPAVTEPLGPRPAAEIYRGFHTNDWTLCVGCSTCQKVCDNAAITMVEIPDQANEPDKGIRNLRPAIDYGRCCWCALCVDLCPTGSIGLSREYVHHCRDDELDSYFLLPDSNGMHDEAFPPGWMKDDTADLVDHQRQPMAEMPAAERIDNFDEIVAGFSPQQAALEASRCVQCGLCHDACPTHMNAPQYIRAIWELDLEQAIREIYASNPFSEVCGRVCTHRCESACSLGHRGDPIAIRWLKRYALDNVSPQRVSEILAEQQPHTSSGQSIAIVGAGPAGMTAAFDLVRQGHTVEVFEAMPAAGGMTRYGIPEYRLPYASLDLDIEQIVNLGVKMHYNTRIGEDVSLQQLRDEFDAVAITIGLQMGRSTRIPGSKHPNVRSAVELLRQITQKSRIKIPQKAVVIGGGNVAMDIARSLARLQKQKHGKVDMTVTALEDIEHFLADPVEIKEAREEGITLLDARGPQEVVVEKRQLKGLRSWKVLSIFDEKHRFAPRYDSDDELLHEADMIIEAIGQMTDTRLLGEELTEALEWNRGRIKVDAECRSSEDWLWLGGDCVKGPDVVHAVADGHTIAASIHSVLSVKEKAA